MGENYSLEDRIAIGVWIAIALSSIAASGCAISMLLKKRSRTVADLFVLNLCISEFLGVMYNVILRPLIWFCDIPHVSIVRSIGSQFVVTLIDLSTVCISLDRLLAVKLNLKYRLIVTQRKTMFVAGLIWSFSFISAGIRGIISSSTFIIWALWSSIAITSIIISYTYISVVLYRRKRLLQTNSSHKNVNRFNYEIPFCITLSYMMTKFIPKLVILADSSLFTIWTLNIFYLNYLIDPLVYVIYVIYRKRYSRKVVPMSRRSSNVHTISTAM